MDAFTPEAPSRTPAGNPCVLTISVVRDGRQLDDEVPAPARGRSEGTWSGNGSTPWAFAAGTAISGDEGVLMQLCGSQQAAPYAGKDARTRVYDVHQVGVREPRVRNGDVPVLAIVSLRGDVSRLLATYDSRLLEITADAPTQPLLHICGRRGDEIVFADVWKSEGAAHEWLSSELGRSVTGELSAIAASTSELELYVVRQMAWPGDARSTGEGPLGYRHRHEYLVHARGRSYRVVYHPASGDGGATGFIVNVFDTAGRALFGSDISEAESLVSSAREARDIVMRSLRR